MNDVSIFKILLFPSLRGERISVERALKQLQLESKDGYGYDISKAKFNLLYFVCKMLDNQLVSKRCSITFNSYQLKFTPYKSGSALVESEIHLRTRFCVLT